MKQISARKYSEQQGRERGDRRTGCRKTDGRTSSGVGPTLGCGPHPGPRGAALLGLAPHAPRLSETQIKNTPHVSVGVILVRPASSPLRPFQQLPPPPLPSSTPAALRSPEARPPLCNSLLHDNYFDPSRTLASKLFFKSRAYRAPPGCKNFEIHKRSNKKAAQE